MADIQGAKKILELRGPTWANGIALQSSSPQGGIFQQASNFDPFEVLGIMQPARLPAAYNSVAITKQINYFANYTTGNAAYTYAFASADSTGVTTLYSIKANDGVITDQSAEITTTSSARGLIVWADTASATRGLVYATNLTLRANSVPVASANDIEILTGLTSAEHKMCKGADGNLYVTNGNKLAKVTSTTGTSGNSAAVFTFDQNLTLRDIANDGRYLVIIADDQIGTDQLGIYNCMIAYWDYTSGTLAQRYDLKLNSMVGVQIMDGNAYVFARDGMYVCNVSSYPRMVYPFFGNSVLSNEYPGLSSQITKKGSDVIIWGSRNSGKIYGYGSLGLGDKKILFQPTSIASGNSSALGVQGLTLAVANILIGSTTPALYIQGISSTRDTAYLRTVSISLPQPYELKYIKVVGRNILASGETVSITVNSQDGTGLVSNTQTFSFTGDGAKQTKILYPFESSHRVFQEFEMAIDSTKFAIQSIELWGKPLENQEQST